MKGKFSRDKGKRGELDVVHFLGSSVKRTGYAGTDNQDATSDYAIYSVKNLAVPLSLKKVFRELTVLEGKDPKKNHYVVVKVNHEWLCVERLSQHRDDHIGTVG